MFSFLYLSDIFWGCKDLSRHAALLGPTQFLHVSSADDSTFSQLLRMELARLNMSRQSSRCQKMVASSELLGLQVYGFVSGFALACMAHYNSVFAQVAPTIWISGQPYWWGWTSKNQRDDQQGHSHRRKEDIVQCFGPSHVKPCWAIPWTGGEVCCMRWMQQETLRVAQRVHVRCRHATCLQFMLL